MRDALSMAVTQFAQYVVLTINFRSIAHAQYAVAGLTAATASVLSYVMTRKVARAETHWGLVGMMFGGAVADMVGIWLTRAWR